MATQTLEFNAATGLTISCKLFALESDTVVATASATEKTNDKNRYSVAFTDIAAGAYRLNGFVGAVGGFANEVYDLLLATDRYLPRSEAASAGGATAEEIVDEIEDRGITTVAVQSGVTSATVLELVQGDTYNGTGKPLLSFTVAVDYTDGWAATLTIRDEDDAVVRTTSGTVASATSITFSMTAPTGLSMDGCPGSWKGKFDVQMSKTTSRVTIARGVCYVYEDQTRT